MLGTDFEYISFKIDSDKFNVKCKVNEIPRIMIEWMDCEGVSPLYELISDKTLKIFSKMDGDEVYKTCNLRDLKRKNTFDTFQSKLSEIVRNTVTLPRNSFFFRKIIRQSQSGSLEIKLYHENYRKMLFYLNRDDLEVDDELFLKKLDRIPHLFITIRKDTTLFQERLFSQLSKIDRETIKTKILPDLKNEYRIKILKYYIEKNQRKNLRSKSRENNINFNIYK